jgi:hypothetical protein
MKKVIDIHTQVISRTSFIKEIILWLINMIIQQILLQISMK